MSRFSRIFSSYLFLAALVVWGHTPMRCSAEEVVKLVPRLGVWADTMALDGGRAGLRVTRIETNAPAMYLRDLPRDFDGPRRFLNAYRDVIVAIDGQAVTRVDDLNAALYRAGEECRLTIFNRTTKREDRYYVTLP